MNLSNAEAHNKLGITSAQAGKLGEAAAHFRHAIADDPQFADSHNNLANILKAQGKFDEAIIFYQQAITLRPDFAMAHNNLGLVFQAQGRIKEAIAAHRAAIACRPDYAEAHFNLGNALLDDDALAAETSYRHAIGLRSNYAEAHMNLGNALRAQERFNEAEACYRQAIQSNPAYAEAHYNLGNILQDHGRFQEAINSFARALSFRPDYIDARMNLGNAYRASGKLHDAQACYQSILLLLPDNAEAHVNLALTCLLQGNFKEGWREYEWRWRTQQLGPHPYDKPLWNGEDFSGKTLLLHSEQGLGDSMQFIRYAPLVKQRGGRVIVSCPASLSRLFQQMEGIDEVVCNQSLTPDHDEQAPLISLPFILRTQLDTIPAAIPYLTPEPEQAALWAERLRPYTGKKIGLVWAGNPRIDQPAARAIDRQRSMPLDQMNVLKAISGATFFSLQKGTPALQAKANNSIMLIDFMDEIHDFADTAALIANLDLVIGVDTSVIHLAGAMGKPVWLLSRFDGCWRWLQDRGDSPWYPSLRIFRQRNFGNWHPVIEDVREALEVLCTPL